VVWPLLLPLMNSFKKTEAAIFLTKYDLISQQSIYLIAPFPLQQLAELREKYTYNIRPFTPATKRSSGAEGVTLPSDEDELDDEDLENITCFTGFIPTGVTGKHKGTNKY